MVPIEWLEGELVRRAVVTFAAAEAAGIARWALRTAVDYANVREQFGQKIGAFQSIKHLCAEMLETAEAVTAAAWDVAAIAFAYDDGGDDQWAFAADVALVTCFDGAVANAKSCIQVLGGIGFTHEHDAHLYLRRALSLRSLVESSDAAAERLDRPRRRRRTPSGARRPRGPRRGRSAATCAPRRSGSRRCRPTSCGRPWSTTATSRRTGRRRTAWAPTR